MGWEIWDASSLPWEVWRSLLRRGLRGAGAFQIHCWSDEGQWAALALKFGARKPTDWLWGTVVEGPVAHGFCSMLFSLERPRPQDGYRKFTPFFSIFLDNGFSSCHYGTELIQAEPGPLPYSSAPKARP